ncbi:MAG: ATP-dependent RecD-like DNA helicase, partial [Floccifex sp.]
ILNEIVKLVMENDFDQMQILAPMYKGYCGIDAINTIIQQIKNPKAPYKNEMKVGNIVFRERDRVMLLKNMAEEDVYNGDMGIITHIEKTKEGNSIEVEFNDHIVTFDHDYLYYLTHAYCVSVHKAQGSEYNIVLFIVDPSFLYMLEKRLIYTAISRAKHHLYIIGNQQVFENQVRLKQKRIRNTSLCLYLGGNHD